jgi:hypothetical protein
MKLFLFSPVIASLSLAAPMGQGDPAPTVTIPFPQATIVGLSGNVEQFPGIPFGTTGQ